MRLLLQKELRLAIHPTAPIFMLLSAMLLIPNYPYYVIFFYTSLAVYFMCLTGRENHDVFYSLLLPIGKEQIVKARFGSVILLELVQLLFAVPFAVLRQMMPVPPNAVGMDANIALFGLSLVMLGIFNLIFFLIYYKNVQKVGKGFLLSSTAVFAYMSIAEALTHVVPFFRDQLDTPDPQYLTAKLVVLGCGLLIFFGLTLIAYKASVNNFEKQDL